MILSFCMYVNIKLRHNTLGLYYNPAFQRYPFDLILHNFKKGLKVSLMKIEDR